MNAKKRIVEYIEYKGYSTREFTANCGFSHTIFQNEQSAIGVDKLEIIITKYPDLSLIWVVTGKGKMINEPSETEVGTNEWKDKYYTILEKYSRLQEQFAVLESDSKSKVTISDKHISKP